MTQTRMNRTMLQTLATTSLSPGLKLGFKENNEDLEQDNSVYSRDIGITDSNVINETFLHVLISENMALIRIRLLLTRSSSTDILFAPRRSQLLLL